MVVRLTESQMTFLRSDKSSLVRPGAMLPGLDILGKKRSQFLVLCSGVLAKLTSVVDHDRANLFRWNSEVKYWQHREDLSKGLLPGSGRWLLDSSEFMQWLQAEASSILWLHGIRMCSSHDVLGYHLTAIRSRFGKDEACVRIQRSMRCRHSHVPY